jgi:glycosyltransferase involved in cell wall biosynthesis
MKKVCIITTVHSPLDTRIFYREALSLAKRYEVLIIASSEKDFTESGIKIKSLGLSKNRFQRFLKGFAAVRLAFAAKADVFHFQDPELIPVGIILKLFTRRPVIYDVHENNPEYILDKEWIPSDLLRRLTSFAVRLVEYIAAKILDGVVVVNEDLLNRFKKFNSNTELIINFPNKNFGQKFLDNDVAKREKVALFLGGIQRSRGVFEILKLIRRFPKQNLKFLFIGSINDKNLQREILEFVRKENISKNKFEMMPQISYTELPDYLNKAFVGIIPFLKTRNNYLGTPLKMFEYMAYGLPIVASDFLFLGKFIREADCGLLIKNPEDTSEYKKAFDTLDDSQLWGRFSHNGRRAFLEKFAWENEEVKLFNLYKEVLNE